MSVLLEQFISNHPDFPNVKRKVVVYDVAIQGRHSQILLDAEVHYFDSNKDDVELHSFNKKIKGWIVNNNDQTTVRDSKGKPVPNPQFREAPSDGEDDRIPEEKEPYLKQPSFDYFFGIIKNPKAPSLINLLALHIHQNDEIQFFDELLAN
ncbi:MAG: hypothetical protein Q4A00_05525 [Flavobacteriaceae bacterium]|nr:hypothetical protein [Flavobacteriaceae bacterium]